MSNLIEETHLLRQNKQDLVEALVNLGIPVTMTTPLSKLVECLKWAAGFGGCPIAVIEKTTSRQKFFSAEEWNAMGSNQRGRYDPIGICLLAEGRALIIAKEDCLSPSNTATMLWSNEGYDNPDLKNYSDSLETVNFYDDFNGKGKTDIICQFAVDRRVAYPAAQQARAYKAFEGDPTEYYLGDVSEWTLIDRFRTEVNAALRAFFGVALTDTEYWTSDEHSAPYAWHVRGSGALGYNNYKNRDNNVCRVRPLACAEVSAIINP